MLDSCVVEEIGYTHSSQIHYGAISEERIAEISQLLPLLYLKFMLLYMSSDPIKISQYQTSPITKIFAHNSCSSIQVT